MSSILTVTQLNRYMSMKLREDGKLRGLLVKGEISGFTNHRASGHFYFTLKDGQAAVKAVMFANYASALSFMPQNGMNVIVMGSVQVFERDGVYQIYVTDIQPDGVGAQYLALEQLKERLSEEGLFAAEHKKQIPPFPERIGIVTAKGGAALRDILNILGRRYPVCEAVVFNCAVQGADAVDSVCGALNLADGCGCDVIICGRGGGSFEDLNAFNSERIARTVFGMVTPVISAVGHETDTTLIDYVSDLRAPTPSAAAELAAPELSAMINTLRSYERSLSEAMGRVIADKKQTLLEAEAELKGHSPAASLSAARERINADGKRLEESIRIYLGRRSADISAKAAALDTLSPLKIMSRGYSLVYRGDELIRSPEALSGGDRIRIKFADGEVSAVIDV